MTARVSEGEIEHDDALERRADQGRARSVFGMGAVGVQALAVHEVHGEPVREALATLDGGEIFAPVAVEQARNATDERCNRLATRFDGLRGAVWTGLQKKNVPDHGLLASEGIRVRVSAAKRT